MENQISLLMIDLIFAALPLAFFIWFTYAMKKAINNKDYGVAIQEGFWSAMLMIIVCIQFFIGGIKSMNRDFILSLVQWLEYM